MRSFICDQQITYGVTSTGNVQGLLMSLSTVLMQDILPSRILVRMEGEFPAFGNFYMEQIAALARIRGVEFTVTTAASQGIRFARDWLIERSAQTSQLLWMGDDDVLYAPDCLGELLIGFEEAKTMNRPSDREHWKVAYVNGNKPDVNNRRGYDDFKLDVKQSSEAQNHEGYNYLFEGPGKTVIHATCDTGNLLINLAAMREHPKARFSVFEKSYNSSGDDTLFALMCQKEGMTGFFRTSADSYHLEKPNVRFNEFSARKNMLLRECALLGIDPENMKRTMLPWLR